MPKPKTAFFACLLISMCIWSLCRPETALLEEFITPGGRETGRAWTLLGAKSKLQYVVGYIEGYEKALIEVRSAAKRKNIETALIEAIMSVPESIAPRFIMYKDIVDALDRAFDDVANMKLPVGMVLLYECQRINGIISDAHYNLLIQEMRKLYMKD